MPTPKYTMKTSIQVDISENSIDEVLAIAQDLNNKGYVVYINTHNMIEEGFGVFNGNIVKNGEIPDATEMICGGSLDRYFKDENSLICIEPNEEEMEKLKTLCAPINIGKTDSGDYEIILKPDGLKIGCQKISKKAAILIARKILKEYRA